MKVQSDAHCGGARSEDSETGDLHRRDALASTAGDAPARPIQCVQWASADATVGATGDSCHDAMTESARSGHRGLTQTRSSPGYPGRFTPKPPAHLGRFTGAMPTHFYWFFCPAPLALRSSAPHSANRLQNSINRLWAPQLRLRTPGSNAKNSGDKHTTTAILRSSCPLADNDKQCLLLVR